MLMLGLAARALLDSAGFEAVRDGNDQMIGEEGSRSMKSLLKSGLSAAVGAVGLGVLSFAVLAEGLPPTSLAHIRPIPVAAPEPPLPEQVAAWCKFPNVTNKIFRQTEIASPVLAEIELPSLKKDIFPAIVEEIFGVKIALTGPTFSFEDESQDPRFRTSVKTDHFPNLPDKPENSQFFDIRGIEAVVAILQSNDEVKSNVYCYLNQIRDSGLCATEDGASCAPPTKIQVYWVLGPSGFAGPNQLQTACESTGADLFVRQQKEGKVDFNGCTPPDHVGDPLIPRFCQRTEGSLSKDEDVVLCQVEHNLVVRGALMAPIARARP